MKNFARAERSITSDEETSSVSRLNMILMCASMELTVRVKSNRVRSRIVVN